jgi:dihydroflavonol-4-reductase
VVACVTGATGFVGGHVARMLLEQGVSVRATFRRSHRVARLELLDGVEPCEADIRDDAALRRAFSGCDVVYHVAGFVGSRPRDRAFTLNARAPRTVVQAAGAAGVRRDGHTSSLAGIGPSLAGPSREGDLYETGRLGLTYADSKHEGEYEALAASAREGVEVVIVNPSYVFGIPIDGSPEQETSTRVIGNYLRGRLPGVLDGGLNAVDVLDVARGHILAAEHGRPGHRYILGGYNMTWVQLLERVAMLSGVRHPLLVLPGRTADVFALLEAVRIPPPMRAEAVRLMSLNWQGNSDKAHDELGYAPRPLDETLTRTIEWHKELIGRDAFRDSDRMSTRTLIASGVRGVERLGLHRLVRPVESLVGVKIVACTD